MYSEKPRSLRILLFNGKLQYPTPMERQYLCKVACIHPAWAPWRRRNTSLPSNLPSIANLGTLLLYLVTFRHFLQLRFKKMTSDKSEFWRLTWSTYLQSSHQAAMMLWALPPSQSSHLNHPVRRLQPVQARPSRSQNRCSSHWVPIANKWLELRSCNYLIWPTLSQGKCKCEHFLVYNNRLQSKISNRFHSQPQSHTSSTMCASLWQKLTVIMSQPQLDYQKHKKKLESNLNRLVEAIHWKYYMALQAIL